MQDRGAIKSRRTNKLENITMRDLQQQVDAGVKQKLLLESEMNVMRERVLALEKELEDLTSRNTQLQQANSSLQTQATARAGKTHANGSLLLDCRVDELSIALQAMTADMVYMQCTVRVSLSHSQ